MQKSIEYIKIKNLLLDDKNPRLPSYLQEASEAKVIEYMLLEAATIELMQAIGENGFYPGEMLLVVGVSGGKYKVIEGNRRLTAVKLLNNPTLAKVQKNKVQKVVSEAKGLPINKIPCLVFDTDEKILKYLGYRHITGVQPWNLRQKARYVHSLKEKNFPIEPLDQACRNLAKMIGSTRDYVKRLIIGFRIYKEIEDNAFFKIKGLEEDTFYFGYISDSLRHINIVEFMCVDLNSNDPLKNINLINVGKWTKWLFEKNRENQTRLKGKSDDLNKLNKILVNPQAFEAFEDGYSLNNAHQLTEDIDKIFMDSIRNALTELEQADGIIHKVKSFQKGLNDELRDILKLVRKIKLAKDEFEGTEFDNDN
ncbi:MAG: ParB N-terminal domain-containing protein [archaeon]|nr:ParB N-terminal domain-containing protein [archaeon]